MTAAPALDVQGLEAGYEPGLPIVRGASLALRPGEIVAVLGPNGAGKSTLVKAAAGLVPISRRPRRCCTAATSPRCRRTAWCSKGLAFVPQTDNVFANLTVAENLRARRRAARLPTSASGWRRCTRCSPTCSASGRLRAGRLSGGQRQMLAVARALIAQPRVLVLDEPSAGLSPKLVRQVFDKLREVRDGGVTVLLVEQNVKAALALADRAAVLVEGRERWSRRAPSCAAIRASPSCTSAAMPPRRGALMLQILADGLVIGSVVSLGAIGADADLLDPALRQLRPRRAARLGRLCRAHRAGDVRRRSAGGARRRSRRSRFGWPLLAAIGARRGGRWRCSCWRSTRLLFKRLRRQGAITLVIASFGAALALRNLLLFIYGGVPRVLLAGAADRACRCCRAACWAACASRRTSCSCWH